MKWINEIVAGMNEIFEGLNLYEIIDALEIEVIKLDKIDMILLGQEALYVRSFSGKEIIYIRDDLGPMERYVLAHELGHAILHPDLAEAYYSPLQNKGKLERQADYFAIKILDLDIDPLGYEGFSQEQLAKALCVKEEALEYIYQTNDGETAGTRRVAYGVQNNTHRKIQIRS